MTDSFTIQQKIYELARSEIGVRETLGEVHTPRVLEYLGTVGMNASDETPWCSAFMNWCCERTGVRGTKSAAARSWLEWGVPVPHQMVREGDLAVLWRSSRHSWKGHVGFVVRVEKEQILLLGGNQGNSVSEKWYAKGRLLGFRRYHVEGDSD